MSISTSCNSKICCCVRVDYVHGRDSNTKPHLVSNYSSIYILATPAPKWILIVAVLLLITW
jgi:hypothetical protein